MNANESWTGQDRSPWQKDRSGEYRRLLLSYRFDVERYLESQSGLLGTYRALSADYLQLRQEHKAFVQAVTGSRIWRWTLFLCRLLHRIKYRQEYVEPSASWSRFPDRLRTFPDPPPYPTLEENPSFRIPAWPETRKHREWCDEYFIENYFFNELHRILNRADLRNRTIFIQTPVIDWFVPLFQRPQHMARAMARRGYLVFYMTANMLSDQAWGFHEIEPGLFVTNQPVHLMTEKAVLTFYSTVATLLSWRGRTIDEVRARGHRLVYEYIDHIDPEISFGTTDQLKKQFNMIDDSSVDLLVGSARTLCRELASKVESTPVSYVPNGVDFDHYSSILAGDDRGTVPLELRNVVAQGKPVVGYFGALAPWLWYEAINSVTRRCTDLNFVFIGPDYLGGSAEIERNPNVFCIGAINYLDLPFYAQHFDVAIIPFKPGPIAGTTSPLKLFEYFAMGLPVVVTEGMHECTEFDVGTFADSDSFELALREGIAKKHAQRTAKLLRCAMENSWDTRARMFSEALDQITNTSRSDDRVD